MKKHLITTLLLIFFIIGTSAQQLNFRNDGTFKIAQFTDTHICAEKPESQDALANIRATIENERPDLIIFTGDVVTGKPAKAGWEMVLSPMVESKIPFCVVLGNHDDEQDISREDIAKMVTACPNNLNIKESKYLVDCVLPIMNGNRSKTEALLYFMDSNTYSKIDTVKGYGWFSYDQVAWYRKTSARYTAQNGSPLPALAFFHIPLPEYTEAYDLRAPLGSGERLEKECSPKINTGMFSAFLESGDVMGTFVGHDHNNDYVAPLYGISLCYGRFSGGKTTYIDIPNGARIIQLKEGEHGFTTWIREKGTTVINRTRCGKASADVLYNAFSHNDYEQKRPVFGAIDYGFNNIEADIHLIDGRLFVAHNFPKDTTKVKTLEEQYLKPLQQLIQRNGGKVYPNSSKPFYLMIDFKSDGEATYAAIQPILGKYKDMLCSVENGVYKERAVFVFFSGNRPFTSLPNQPTRYAFLDGRISDLGKKIPATLMPVISDNYSKHFKWNGKGEMPANELKLLRSIIRKTHKESKKLRFWGAPDTEVFRQLMLKEGIDLFGTDNLENLYQFLQQKK